MIGAGARIGAGAQPALGARAAVRRGAAGLVVASGTVGTLDGLERWARELAGTDDRLTCHDPRTFERATCDNPDVTMRAMHRILDRPRPMPDLAHRKRAAPAAARAAGATPCAALPSSSSHAASARSGLFVDDGVAGAGSCAPRSSGEWRAAALVRATGRRRRVPTVRRPATSSPGCRRIRRRGPAAVGTCPKRSRDALAARSTSRAALLAAPAAGVELQQRRSPGGAAGQRPCASYTLDAARAWPERRRWCSSSTTCARPGPRSTRAARSLTARRARRSRPSIQLALTSVEGERSRTRSERGFPAQRLSNRCR